MNQNTTILVEMLWVWGLLRANTCLHRDIQASDCGNQILTEISREIKTECKFTVALPSYVIKYRVEPRSCTRNISGFHAKHLPFSMNWIQSCSMLAICTSILFCCRTISSLFPLLNRETEPQLSYTNIEKPFNRPTKRMPLKLEMQHFERYQNWSFSYIQFAEDWVTYHPLNFVSIKC